MTKVMIPNFDWVYLHVVLDWGIKKLLSAHLSLTSKDADWIYALNEAVNLQFPDGIRKAAKFLIWSSSGNMFFQINVSAALARSGKTGDSCRTSG